MPAVGVLRFRQVNTSGLIFDQAARALVKRKINNQIVRRRLRVSLDRLLNVDWRKEIRAGRRPITQLIGEAASEVGVKAMIVPSAATAGDNLVVFTGNLGSGSTIRILNADQL